MFTSTEDKTSIFRSNVMNQASAVLSSVLEKNENIDVSVLEKTNFDEEKFLRVAQNAINAMYANTKLAVDLVTDRSIDSEYSNVMLEITHKPNAQLNEPLFFINNSAMHAELINNTNTSPIEQQRIYKLPIPTGTNRIRVEVSSLSGETAVDTETVVNKFNS